MEQEKSMQADDHKVNKVYKRRFHNSKSKLTDEELDFFEAKKIEQNDKLDFVIKLNYHGSIYTG